MIAEIGFFVVGEAHGSCRYSSGALKISPLKPDTLMFVIDYYSRISITAQPTAVNIDYRLSIIVCTAAEH